MPVADAADAASNEVALSNRSLRFSPVVFGDALSLDLASDLMVIGDSFEVDAQETCEAEQGRRG